MKKLLLCLLFASVTTSLIADCDSCDCDYTARSYLNVHPQFQSFSPEYFAGFKSDRLHAKEDGCGGAFQFVVLGGSSTKGKKLATYFLPFCEPVLTAGEDINFTTQENDFDILATDFNVYTQNGDFLSTFGIKPKQSMVGFGVHYRQAFWQMKTKAVVFGQAFPSLCFASKMI